MSLNWRNGCRMSKRQVGKVIFLKRWHAWEWNLHSLKPERCCSPKHQHGQCSPGPWDVNMHDHLMDEEKLHLPETPSVSYQFEVSNGGSVIDSCLPMIDMLSVNIGNQWSRSSGTREFVSDSNALLSKRDCLDSCVTHTSLTQHCKFGTCRNHTHFCSTTWSVDKAKVTGIIRNYSNRK